MTIESTAPIARPSGARRYRVLFLDDEEAILSALRSLFRKESYDTQFFSDPAPALAALQRAPVDLIVSDLRMPVISGTEFLARAMTIQPSPIRIMLSGYEDKPVVITAIAHGLAKDYIMKPWDDAAFREMIAENLRLRDRLRATELEKVLGRVPAWPLPPRSDSANAGTLPGGDVSIQDVVTIVERSPSLIARLLRVANSVHYGTRQTISTVREAVLFVGTEFVLSLLMALESSETLHHSAAPESRQLVERLWRTATRRATIARAIAGRWDGFDGRHIAFIASLFQDIGFIVRAQTDPRGLSELLCKVDGHGVPILQADASMFGITHEYLGATLLRFWNFPGEIIAAIEGHHGAADPTTLQRILLIAEEVERLDASASTRPAASAAAVEWHGKIPEVLNELAQRQPMA